jgi:hypothetical protein
LLVNFGSITLELNVPTPQNNPHQVSSLLQLSVLPLPHHIRSLAWKALRHRLVFCVFYLLEEEQANVGDLKQYILSDVLALGCNHCEAIVTQHFYISSHNQLVYCVVSAWIFVAAVDKSSFSEVVHNLLKGPLLAI